MPPPPPPPKIRDLAPGADLLTEKFCGSNFTKTPEFFSRSGRVAVRLVTDESVDGSSFGINIYSYECPEQGYVAGNYSEVSIYSFQDIFWPVNVQIDCLLFYYLSSCFFIMPWSHLHMNLSHKRHVTQFSQKRVGPRPLILGALAYPGKKIKPVQFSVPEYTDEKWLVTLLVGTVSPPCSHREPCIKTDILRGRNSQIYVFGGYTYGTQCLPGVIWNYFSSMYSGMEKCAGLVLPQICRCAKV